MINFANLQVVVGLDVPKVIDQMGRSPHSFARPADQNGSDHQDSQDTSNRRNWLWVHVIVESSNTQETFQSSLEKDHVGIHGFLSE